MYKGREIIGKPVISYDTGEKFDTAKDLIFDQESNQLLGFLVQESGWFRNAQILLLKDVKAIGINAIVVTSKSAIIRASKLPTIGQILKHNTILKGTRILTVNGQDLGIVSDLYFDEQLGNIEGYEVSGGLFADAYSGRSFVPALQTLKIGRDVAFVPAQTSQLMEEQIGGIKAAMQTVSGKFQETAQVTGDKVHEFGRIASEQAQEATQATGDRLLELSRNTNTSITNAMIEPTAQKSFVMGKIVERSVVTPEGESLGLKGKIVTQEIVDLVDSLGILDELYRATGGNLADPLKQRLGNAVAGLTVEQAQGKRVQQAVRNDEGSIIVAQGQIVTERIIEQVKNHHREHVLLQSVGLSAGDAFQDRTSSAMTLAGDRVKVSTHDTGEQLQSGARELWTNVRETVREIQNQSTQAIEEKRIRGALGRPVTRVILDQQDQVILNVGELITHQSIASARQANVLDLLLTSVYSRKPQLSFENLRAPQTGSAAL